MTEDFLFITLLRKSDADRQNAQLILSYRQQLKGEKMIDKFLMDLGLTEDAVNAKELNGKFIAILRRCGKSGDPEIIRVTEEIIIPNEDGETRLLPGDILAHENPIEIQEITEKLYPQYSGADNKDGKHILLCYIPKNLSVF